MLTSPLNMLSRALFSRRNLRASLPVVHFVRVRAYTVPADPHIPKKTKVWDSVDEAVGTVKSGDVLLSGGKLLSTAEQGGAKNYTGFGLCGTPGVLSDALGPAKLYLTSKPRHGYRHLDRRIGNKRGRTEPDRSL